MYDQPAGPPPNYGYPAMPPVYSQPRPGRALAVVSLVLSSIAVAGMILIGLYVVSDDSSDSDPGSEVPLTGQLSTPPSGRSVTGATLADDVTARITQDGGDVSQMTCPSTAKIAQGVVTVCHGVISGSDWAVLVFFEDASGRFTLSPV